MGLLEQFYDIGKIGALFIWAERHIYVSVNYASIASDNGLSSARTQSIVRSNVGLLLIGNLGINFGES